MRDRASARVRNCRRFSVRRPFVIVTGDGFIPEWKSSNAARAVPVDFDVSGVAVYKTADVQRVIVPRGGRGSRDRGSGRIPPPEDGKDAAPERRADLCGAARTSLP
jgi:hypothetical protein